MFSATFEFFPLDVFLISRTRLFLSLSLEMMALLSVFSAAITEIDVFYKEFRSWFHISHHADNSLIFFVQLLDFQFHSLVQYSVNTRWHLWHGCRAIVIILNIHW